MCKQIMLCVIMIMIWVYFSFLFITCKTRDINDIDSVISFFFFFDCLDKSIPSTST